MAELDRIDLKILRALADDGRLSWRDPAQKVGLSLTSMLRRVCCLEEERYIQGYFVRFGEERLSGAMSVLVPVSLEEQTGDHLVRFEKRIVDTSQATSCFQMTGDVDYMLRVVVKDLTAHQVFLTNTPTCIPGVAGIKSAFILKLVMLCSAPPL